MEVDFIQLTLGAITLILSVAYLLVARRRRFRDDKNAVDRPPNRPLSFRKREKIIFYGRKLIRKVSEGRRERMASIIAKRLLKLRKETLPTRNREPSQSLLEVELPGLESTDQTLPAEMMYMLRNVRVLGHFEEPIFLELCRFVESRSIPANTFLFRIGDDDDCIHVVQAGKVRLYIGEPDGSQSCVKEVEQGESIHSLLSILDVLTGCQAKYKTVFAIAEVDSTVLRLPMKTLRAVLDRYPESLVRVVQIIAMRLQRVTFLALHNYLGLSQELFNQSTKPVVRSDPSSASVVWSNRKQQGFHDDEGHCVHPRGTPAGAEEDNTRPCVKIQLCPNRQGSTPETRFKSAVSFAHECLNTSPRHHSEPKEKQSKLGASAERLRSRTNSSKGGCSRASSEEVFQEATAAGSNLLSDKALRSGVRALADLLGITDESLLNDKCRVMSFEAGSTLVREGDHEDSLYLIISGCLRVKQQLLGSTKEQRTLYTVQPGELVGSLAVLTGEPSLFTIETETDSTIVLGLDKKDFYAILKQKPQIVLNMGQIVLSRMSPFVRQIDFALDWVFIEAGRALYRQGEKSDCVYIVLNGRLRAICHLASGKKELAGEHGRGELVGLVEVLTQTLRPATMMAVRDTELAQIPDGLLHLIKRTHPQIVTRLIHLLGQRILGHLTKQPNLFTVLSKHPLPEPRPLVTNFSTVAVLPVSDRVPLTNFSRELHRALDLIGPTLCLSRESVQARLGSSAFDCINAYRLSSWLSQQEEVHRMVLYQCDFHLSPWTHRCVRQADCVLVVAVADHDHSVGELERQLEMLSSRAQKELVLLHREDSPGPRDTLDWLSRRNWITAHYHVRCPADVLSRKTQRSKVRRVARTSDFSRLARILTGTAVGVVLGGGAARGCAHVGILRAMVEADIPIDMVGGTSIGAFMGALWSQETNFVDFRRLAKEWSLSMSSIWSLMMDFTYPVTSLLSGNRFNRKIESVLRDCNIEDLWLPYFCVTTDVTASKMRVHTQGCLWRYVRSSMSLAGYLPPLCDPLDGHLLVDGAYVNNLPADVMKTMGAQTIIAVDVSSESSTDFTNYGDELSGWWFLWTQLCPWVKKARVPGIIEVQSRLAYVSCERLLEAIKSSNFYDYVRPPISKYQSLQFAKFDEIAQVGYKHGKALFDEWQRTGRTQKLFARAPSGETPTTGTETGFTNLADMLSPNTEANHACAVTSPLGRAFGQERAEDKMHDRISVSSEPILSLWLESTGKLDSCGRDRTVSEGASLCSLLGSFPAEDESDSA